MAKNHKTLEEIITLVFEAFEKANLSLKEISESANVDILFLEALLDPENPIVKNLSSLIGFSNIKLTPRIYNIKHHEYKVYEKYIVLYRRIEPKCSIRIDKSNGEFYNLALKNKSKTITPIQKDIVLYDFQLYRENKKL